MKVIRYLSFWTNNKIKCWFEYQIQKDKDIVAVGAFGTYRQEALRNAQNKSKELYPNIELDFDIEGTDVKSRMFSNK